MYGGRQKGRDIRQGGMGYVMAVRTNHTLITGSGRTVTAAAARSSRTENGIARMPGGGEAAWFKDSEGNLVGVVPA